MLRKNLSFLIFFAAVPAFADGRTALPQAWANSHYGACYRSIEPGMAAVYGPDYATDDNVVSTTAKYVTGDMLLTQDRTTGTNSPRTIFEKRGRNRWCVVLTSPPVASIKAVPSPGRSARPTQWVTLTQAAPGFSETKVVYLWSRAKALYVPSRCYRVSRTKTTELACKDAYN
jgi:hypothetical protein